MGKSASKYPTPNVRERHSRALYINIPVSLDAVRRFILQPCLCDMFEDSCWISLVVDDLDVLESHSVSGIFFTTGMQGWMVKTNLLVRCKVPTWSSEHVGEVEEVPGYQILSLDFENGVGGNIKTLGARVTQFVPTTTARFKISSGKSGSTINSPLSDGLAYRAEVTSCNAIRSPLISISGKLRAGPHTDRVLRLMEFVINRPNKFLHQVGNDFAGYAEWTATAGSDSDLDPATRGKLAFSPEVGAGAEFDHTGCVLVEVEELAVPILSRLDAGRTRLLDEVDLTRAVCFVQPQYILVDHANTVLN
jgi:hypothetical protein